MLAIADGGSDEFLGTIEPRRVTAPSGTVFTALTFERSVAEFRSNV